MTRRYARVQLTRIIGERGSTVNKNFSGKKRKWREACIQQLSIVFSNRCSYAYRNMARAPRNPTIPPKYSPEQAIPMLQRQLQRLEQEILKLPYNDPKIEAWEQRTKTLLNDTFGQPNGGMHGNTKEFAYASTDIPLQITPFGGSGVSHQTLQNGYIRKQEKRVALLKQYIEQLQDDVNLSRSSFSSKHESSVSPFDTSRISGASEPHTTKSTVFIGHGHSLLWHQLKDFLQENLNLKCVEFNSESTAGITTKERLEAMLDNAGFAFLVMTAEDERVDGTLHPRENVIHEAGLFQGRLGFKRAIILKEESCEEFSNIHGLTHISFPKGRISAAFEDIRKVLEREGIKHT